MEIISLILSVNKTHEQQVRSMRTKILYYHLTKFLNVLGLFRNKLFVYKPDLKLHRDIVLN